MVKINLSRLVRKLDKIFNLGTYNMRLELLPTVQPVVDVLEAVKEFRAVVVAATAGNVVTTITVPNDQTWLWSQFLLYLITDATVADRYVTVKVYNKSGQLYLYPYLGAAHAASTTKDHQMNHAGYFTGASAGGNGIVGIGFPYILEGGDYITVTIANGVAGDSYSGNFRFGVRGGVDIS